MEDLKIMVNIEYIKSFIKKNKMSKKTFCRLCGISYGTYRKLENGKTNFSSITIRKIALFCECRISDIFYCEN